MISAPDKFSQVELDLVQTKTISNYRLAVGQH